MVRGSGGPHGREAVFGIIADDLTGACDVASSFANEGFIATVDLRGDYAAGPGAEVMVHDANLRTVHGEAATLATAEAITKMVASGIRFCMLKVDSTLRGPIPEMMHAALASTPDRTAVAANALPVQGRLVRSGRLLVNGHEADVDLASRFGSHARLIALPDLVERGPAPGSVAVLDEQDEGSLARLARWWVGLAQKPLMVGSAGVARSLAEELALRSRFDRDRGATARDTVWNYAARESGADGSEHDSWLLLVVGSPTRESARQVKALEAALGPEAVLMGTEVVLLCVSNSDVRDDGSASASIAAGAIAELNARARRPAAVVLVGGDTARLVLDGLAATGIQVVGEAVPGVPRGFVLGGTLAGVAVATKAGAFGDETVLVRTMGELARGTSDLEEVGPWT